MTSIFSTEQHRKFFAEFCKWEMASGGPDPQLPMVHHMATAGGDIDGPEHLWRALCYIAVYNVPYGEVFWDNLHRDSPRSELAEWLSNGFNAGLITTRTERKTVRRADWMLEYMSGAQRFVENDGAELWGMCADRDPYDAYEIAWTTVLKMPRVGRYTAIKLIEYMRRFMGLPVATPDIRPKDAWSPRHTLAYIFPNRHLGNRDNSPAALKMATQTCDDTIRLLEDEYDVKIDMFQLQVLLCEYRESWESKKQYPGRSLDSELKYARRAETEWGHTSKIWAARKALFPAAHLGEIQGWDGPRKDVAECLRLRGYTWTDLKYDYKHTKDMTNPVEQPI